MNEWKDATLNPPPIRWNGRHNVSSLVLGLFPDDDNGPLWSIRPVMMIDYDEESGVEVKHNYQWFTVEWSGAMDWCASHGGVNPVLWCEIPEIPDLEAVRRLKQFIAGTDVAPVLIRLLSGYSRRRGT